MNIINVIFVCQKPERIKVVCVCFAEMIKLMCQNPSVCSESSEDESEKTFMLLQLESFVYMVAFQ